MAPRTPSVDDERLFPRVRTCNGMNDKQAVVGENCVNKILDNSQRKKKTTKKQTHSDATFPDWAAVLSSEVSPKDEPSAAFTLDGSEVTTTSRKHNRGGNSHHLTPDLQNPPATCPIMCCDGWSWSSAAFQIHPNVDSSGSYLNELPYFSLHANASQSRDHHNQPDVT